ncbi:MAG: hypothetical protein IJ131_02630 [Eggerthellaceae bacterium]|nr:hypothetical protein [Eggerthellaceae bacterium]
MTRIRFATDCKASFAQITFRRLQNRLDDPLDLMVEVPTFGSKLVRDSLKKEFGSNCMKADLEPFLLIYENMKKKKMWCMSMASSTLMQ